MPVVAEHLDHSALADMVTAAFFDHAFQFYAQSLKFLQPKIDLFQVGASDSIGSITTCVGCI